MKQLIRRLSRVSDSSQYILLRSSDSSSPAQTHSKTRRSKSKSNKTRGSVTASGLVPQGHLPVYVGDEMERFVVRADCLKHPIFIQLLERSAQEYGYEQQGVLRIPCRVFLFERVLDILKDGDEIDSADVDELFGLFSEEFL
ncbi:auxin-responsive protein SAUR71-like [Magnolia sinica]|uniref:auxin-responsive protein SAUR71-like n=1 Tax=Magnolia sinica TaxID=86752 RepID=UPI0026586471|nr:auxin-responsive protein SAUR71-like [Magnolia sinica]